MTVEKRTAIRCPGWNGKCTCDGWLDMIAGVPEKPQAVIITHPELPITFNQRACIFAICKRRGITPPEKISTWDMGTASDWIKANDG